MSTTSNTNLTNLNNSSLLYNNNDHALAKNNIYQEGSTNKSSIVKNTQSPTEESTHQESINKECALNTQITNFINSLEPNESKQVI